LRYAQSTDLDKFVAKITRSFRKTSLRFRRRGHYTGAFVYEQAAWAVRNEYRKLKEAQRLDY